MQTHLEPDQDHGKGQHSSVAIRSLIISGRHSAKLLQTVDQPFNLVALAVKCWIKGPSGMFVLLPGYRGSDASPLQVSAIFPESISFIACNPLWTDTQVSTTTPDCTLFHQLFSHGDLMLLSRS
jgi:hypothetical protein